MKIFLIYFFIAWINDKLRIVTDYYFCVIASSYSAQGLQINAFNVHFRFFTDVDRHSLCAIFLLKV